MLIPFANWVHAGDGLESGMYLVCQPGMANPSLLPVGQVHTNAFPRNPLDPNACSVPTNQVWETLYLFPLARHTQNAHPWSCQLGTLCTSFTQNWMHCHHFPANWST